MFEVLKGYIFWHYSTAYVDQVYLFRHCFWFLNRFFSVHNLFLNLLSPWKRLNEKKGSILQRPGEFFESLILNTMMRIIGFIIRISLLIIAFFCFVTLFAFAGIFVIFWTVSPLVLGYFFAKGVSLLLP